MKLLSTLEISLIVGFIGGVPVSLVVMLLYKLFVLPFLIKGRREAAETVVAELDHGSVRYDTDRRNGQTLACYNYTVDGKQCRYRTTAGRLNLDDQITLYYLPGDEAHAETMQRFTGDRHVFRKCYPVSVAICAVIVEALMLLYVV